MNEPISIIERAICCHFTGWLFGWGNLTYCEIIPFDFGKHAMTTIVDDKGNSWWVASEVYEVLGYVNSPGAVAKHCLSPQIISIPNRYSIRGNPNKTIINEEDLYRLITHSQLPAAKDFERWIMEKVVPSIRKTVSYTKPAAEKPMSHVENISRGLLSAAHVIEQMTKRPSDGFIATIKMLNNRYERRFPVFTERHTPWSTRGFGRGLPGKRCQSGYGPSIGNRLYGRQRGKAD